MAERICSIEGCDRSHVARGYCKRHYRSFRKYGDPLAGLKRYQEFTDTHKRCADCTGWKPLDQFGPSPRTRSGLSSYCRPCQSVRSVASMKRRTPEQLAAAAARRHRRVLKTYGLTPADYERMLAEQAGRCAVCGTGDPGFRRFHVDHNHLTGSVRGLLCHFCNTAIGLAGDDPVRLEALAAYLRSR